MLANEDCVSYWKAPPSAAKGAARVQVAFEQRWFGNKSESRVKTLLGDMALRFDAYPAALEALRVWRPAAEVAPWICHLHTQLADPIYRRFTGQFLPERRARGFVSVDRDAVARWVQEEWPERWAPVTCLKFAGNMLSTAYEAGLLKDRKDPRRLTSPRPPRVVLEYLLYLLREVECAGGVVASLYLRSVLPEGETLERVLRGAGSVQVQTMGDAWSFDWAYPSLRAWADAQASGGSRRGDGILFDSERRGALA